MPPKPESRISYGKYLKTVSIKVREVLSNVIVVRLVSTVKYSCRLVASQRHVFILAMATTY